LLSVKTIAPSLNWTYPGSTRHGVPFDDPGSQSKDGGFDEVNLKLRIGLPKR
jgi:hypothetical protein